MLAALVIALSNIQPQQRAGRPVSVVRWTPAMVREVETIRDRILGMCGSPEPVIEPDGEEAAMMKVTRQWRRPLSVVEVTRLAPTPEVRERRGRP